ncbi:MAG: IS3 family transposase [Betaproteobacteria bacterium]|nr:IS3 family transposase [Betaproteobacteria bacterium]
MYRVLGVNRAGFYAWLHKLLSDRAIEDQRLLTLIRDSHADSGRVCGARRVFADLREAGERCGKNRATRIMNEHKIKAQREHKTPGSVYGRPVLTPNTLNQEFTVDAPDKAWVKDTSSIPAPSRVSVILPVALDLDARKLVGRSMETSPSPKNTFRMCC